MYCEQQPRGYWLPWLLWLPHPAKSRRYWDSAVATFAKPALAVATTPAATVIGSQLVADGGYCETPVNAGLTAPGSQAATVAALSLSEAVKCTINT
jgi:hypothetical protein